MEESNNLHLQVEPQKSNSKTAKIKKRLKQIYD